MKKYTYIDKASGEILFETTEEHHVPSDMVDAKMHQATGRKIKDGTIVCRIINLDDPSTTIGRFDKNKRVQY